ncbi:MAG TPA: hypothetical protein VK459_01800 [Polyangiaceae bacterium]|nr:hypothetical protein [Polyangiaceae bacterium]
MMIMKKPKATLLFSGLLGAASVAIAILGAPACGDDGSAATSASANSGGAGGAGGSGGGGPNPIACEGAPAELSVDGAWAAYGRLSIKLVGAPGGAITICPTDQVSEGTLLLLVTFEQDPADKTKITKATATLCSLELPVVTALVGMCDPTSASLVSTQIEAPDPFIKALPKLTAVPTAGSLGGLTGGSTVDLERFVVTAGSSKTGAELPGWNAADPACGAADIGHTDCDPMCVADCAGLVDDDGDTYPGVTLHVCGKTADDVKKGVECNAEQPNEPGATLQGKAFLDLEVDPMFTGQAASSCEITGTIDTGVNYNIVGADVYLTGGAISVTSAIKSLPMFEVDAAASKFRMVRIDGQFGAPDWQVSPADPAGACSILIQRANEL